VLQRKELVNLISQLAIKLISVPYSLLMIGLFVRELPEQSHFMLLSTQNYTALVSLAQLGLGGFLLRRISHVWAGSHRLEELPEIKGAFWTSIVLTSSTAVATIVAALLGMVDFRIVPIILLSLAGVSTIVGDYVRIAKSDVAKLNLILFCFYAAGFLVGITYAWVFDPNLVICTLIAFGPPFFATLVSFSLLLKDLNFRRMVRFTGAKAILTPLRDAMPILLTSTGFVAILNVPLVNSLIPQFPAIGSDALACLRLFSSALNVFFFALQPLIPVILSERYRKENNRFETFSVGLLAGLTACAGLAGVAFYLASPTFINIWLGITVPAAVAQDWGLVAFLWLTITILAFFCQTTSRPFLAAVMLLIAAGSSIVVGVVNFTWTVGQSLAMGLLVGVIVGLGAVALAIADPRRDRGQQINTTGTIE
jgi:hypothetical protein